MGWFEDQINQRKELDQQLFEESFLRTAGVVMGKRTAVKMGDERFVTKQAIDDVLKYYHLKPVDVPSSITGPDDQLDFCLRPYGLMRRNIELKEGWYRDAYGPILGRLKESGSHVALLPDTITGYYYRDANTGKKVRLNTKTAASLELDAYCFYKPLPLRKIGIPDLLKYMNDCLTMNDMFVIIASTLAVTVVGLLIPRVTKALTGPVLTSGRNDMLVAISVCLLCTLLSSQLFTSIRGMLMSRIQTKTSVGVEASMMMRVMSLPADFFRKYSAGELTSRSSSVNTLCTLLIGMVFSTGLSSLSSLLFIPQIFSFAPSLVAPSMIIIVITTVFSIVSSLVQMRISKLEMDVTAKESGMTYSIITGVQKIKLSGAEKRIFSKWMDLYAEGAEYTYNPPMFLKINSVIGTGISLVSTIVLYFLAVQSNVDPSSYIAFNAAYASVMGAFSSLSASALSVARIRPILEMAEPFLKAEPEVSEDREIVTRINGSIELNNVSFRYRDNTPYVIDNVSFKIRAGEYVAIVGRTGCGKSTLMRLLLGFEKPERGAIYYDGKDMTRLDLCTLRRKIGAVIQNGGLFQGDIASNILISAPQMTLDDAWAAAETAGIADDIRAMPMGMNTIISEGQGGISGGQKQRLMIARAIVSKPRLLMFDEATSALDNKTQKQISEALDKMGCTRIIIAHRLSTIRNCDRILVLDGGSIIEDGTYDQLIKKNGFFAELVKRQRLDLGQDDK